MIEQSPPREPDYHLDALLVEGYSRARQNVPGRDYSDPQSRADRIAIALNVHAGRDPLEGLR